MSVSIFSGTMLGHRGNARWHRQKNEWMGRIGELIAAVMLMARGYRVLRQRVRSKQGEIDLIAVRGRRIAFCEVKYRKTLAEAQSSVSLRQARRIARAAECWVWQHPAFRDYEIGLDAIWITPLRLPRHEPNALQVL